MADTEMAKKVSSMTGFASMSGDSEFSSWDWEIRGVNGKGLDLRLRLPDGCDALEKQVRTEAGKHVARGNITVTLRLTEKKISQAASLDPEGVRTALEVLAAIEENAASRGLGIVPVSAAEIASMPGVLVTGAKEKSSLPEGLPAEVPQIWKLFAQMRQVEGEVLKSVLLEQLALMTAAIETAANTAEARSARQGDLLRERVRSLVDQTELADPARLNQELAILAVKADVTEEIDRLRAHVEAARGLLSSGGTIGRKLDFLMQEFNREANTLCSKSGSAELTAVGLDMKVLIDQMREQVQNLE